MYQHESATDIHKSPASQSSLPPSSPSHPPSSSQSAGFELPASHANSTGRLLDTWRCAFPCSSPHQYHPVLPTESTVSALYVCVSFAALLSLYLRERGSEQPLATLRIILHLKTFSRVLSCWSFNISHFFSRTAGPNLLNNPFAHLKTIIKIPLGHKHMKKCLTYEKNV